MTCDGSPQGSQSIIFARIQLYRADRREILHDHGALSRMWVSPILVAIFLGSPNRGQNVWTICLRRNVVGLCHKQDCKNSH